MRLPYLDYVPELVAPATIADTAAAIGRTRAGARLELRGYATLRADGEAIAVGANAWFAERSTVHIVDATLATAIGDDVSVGRYAVVHACTIGDGTVVADGAAVLDAAVVGPHALIAADSLVAPRKSLPGGYLYAGYPVVRVRAIDREELAAIARGLRSGASPAIAASARLPPLDMTPFLPQRAGAGPLHALHGAAPRIASRAYVAPTAVVAGDVELANDAGIYFGCAVSAGDARIAIGPRTNIQDNSILATDRQRGDLTIGADVTVGHNARLGSGTIEDDALVGIGSIVGDRAVVERGGCVAAGAWVESGAVVRAGWIWAGRPARRFRPVKDAERASFARGAAVYVRYGRCYRDRLPR
jgi:carbonic anhydrase/acetyltransferase-like protein (isoleucine patch superfamily)